MRVPKIIGLLGRSRSGKDTVADFLIATYPDIPFTKVRLSAPIKDAVCALYGFTPEQVEGPAKEIVVPSVGVSPRQAMVHLTSSMMQQNGKDFFTNRLYRGLDAAAKSMTTVPIIPDIRYEHDIHEIQRRGGIVIKIHRSDPSLPRHNWEDSIDYLVGDTSVFNDSTHEDLYAQVRKVFSI